MSVLAGKKVAPKGYFLDIVVYTEVSLIPVNYILSQKTRKIK